MKLLPYKSRLRDYMFCLSREHQQLELSKDNHPLISFEDYCIKEYKKTVDNSGEENKIKKKLIKSIG